MFHSGRVIRSVGKGYVSCTGVMATQRWLANTMGRQNARSIVVWAPNKRILADAFKSIAALQRDRACGSISCYLPSSPVLTFSSNPALCWTEDWKKSPPIPSPVPRSFLTRKAIPRSWIQRLLKILTLRYTMKLRLPRTIWAGGLRKECRSLLNSRRSEDRPGGSSVTDSRVAN